MAPFALIESDLIFSTAQNWYFNSNLCILLKHVLFNEFYSSNQHSTESYETLQILKQLKSDCPQIQQSTFNCELYWGTTKGYCSEDFDQRVKAKYVMRYCSNDTWKNVSVTQHCAVPTNTLCTNVCHMAICINVMNVVVRTSDSIGFCYTYLRNNTNNWTSPFRWRWSASNFIGI